MPDTVLRYRYEDRAIGGDGIATRTALLDELERHLLHTPWRLVTVRDVARDAGLSPSAFYQYFPGLVEAFYAVCARIAERGGDLPEHLGLILALVKFERRIGGA